MTTYARLTEHNESEGETWSHYIPIPGNETALDLLGRVVDALNSQYDSDEEGGYGLSREPISEGAVDILVKHGNESEGYMARHTKLIGRLVLPSNVLELAEGGEDDPLYKGSVTEYMREG